MGKQRSGEPAKAFSSEVGTGSREENASNKKRPTRRSIVELTEAARRAADDGLLPPVVIAPASDQPRPAAGRAIAFDAIDGGTDDVSPWSWPGLPAFAQELRRAEPPCRVEAEGEVRSRPSTSSPAARKQDIDARHKAGHDESVGAVDSESRTESVARSAKCEGPAAGGEKHDAALPHPAASGTCELNPSDSTADMLAKIAKACQASALDDIKTGLGVALDYAADLAEKRPSSREASTEREPGNRDDTAAAAAADYQAEAFALMKANIAATLDYTRQLMLAKGPAEFVELSSTHARKQCELVLEQTRVLRSFARTVTKSDAA